MINAVCVTGPAGNGKTTFIELLHELLGKKFESEAIEHIDMSRIFSRWGMSLHGSLGQRVRQSSHLMSEGKYMPDDLTIELFQNWVESWLKQRSGLRVLFLGGAPRTPDQNIILKLFKNSVVLHISATEEQSYAALERRMLENFGRSDLSRPDEIALASDPEFKAKLEGLAKTRWEDYQTKTVPAVKQLNGNCLNLSRDMPLTDRLRVALLYLKKKEETGVGPVPLRFISKALSRLDTNHHAIHKKILSIESPGSVVPQSAVACQPSSQEVCEPATA